MTIVIEREIKMTGQTFYNIRIDGEYKTSFDNEESANKYFEEIKKNYINAKIETIRAETF